LACNFDNTALPLPPAAASTCYRELFSVHGSALPFLPLAAMSSTLRQKYCHYSFAPTTLPLFHPTTLPLLNESENLRRRVLARGIVHFE
ncbi:MAG: hypothetical protein AAGE59_16995, partial [Cyanobacteria bacterium P01_F01_bin.86]